MKRRKSQPVLRRRDCRRRCSGAVHELECELGIYWGYSRMPPELLCRVISSLQSTIEEGFPYHNDRNILLAAAIICLTKLFLCLPQRVSTICCWEKFQQVNSQYFLFHSILLGRLDRYDRSILTLYYKILQIKIDKFFFYLFIDSWQKGTIGIESSRFCYSQ
ncbi:uncharacterized protein LOC130987954 isoform X1 [Salvia miltiorrhiza]|uniref:uncharacterized protein LOC130987954 isoform X1 n=1 Tax=Salvia miltiorrhiza TaxID=226208 RepID=UPI0025AD09DE|nr:uncharacterized protein LOC130987954 isoform X1 [Salvia miltiorrhiza]